MKITPLVVSVRRGSTVELSESDESNLIHVLYKYREFSHVRYGDHPGPIPAAWVDELLTRLDKARNST